MELHENQSQQAEHESAPNSRNSEELCNEASSSSGRRLAQCGPPIQHLAVPPQASRWCRIHRAADHSCINVMIRNACLKIGSDIKCSSDIKCYIVYKIENSTSVGGVRRSPTQALTRVTRGQRAEK